MKRNALLIVCSALGLLIVGAAAFQGPLTFAGPRWNLILEPFTLPPQLRPTGPPASETPQPQNATRPSSFSGDPALIAWIIAIVVVLVGVAVLLRWLSRRPRRFTQPILPVADLEVVADAEPAAEPDPEVAAPVVLRGLARALEVLEEERVPSDGIVKAWLGLQEAAEDSGVFRRPAETPTEFTSRIIRRVGSDGDSATTLLALYQDVRFGGHPAEEPDVETARVALRELEAAWHPAGVSSRGSTADASSQGGDA